MERIQIPLRVLLLLAALNALPAQALFINELHYDNAGTDSGEGVELAGTAGTDLGGYELLFYNGSNGSVYRSVALSGVLGDQDNGFGAAFFAVSALQNGAPDAVALVDPAGIVMQFLSYEGAFTASSGAAAGMLSTDIGVFEDGTGAAGMSLQLIGQGSAYADFTWVAAAASYDLVNAGQSFSTTPVPLPAAFGLLFGGVSALAALTRRARTTVSVDYAD